MRELKSRLSQDTRFGLMRLGGIVDENIYENDFVRIWFKDELPLAARFLLNYTDKYNVVDQ